MGDFQVIMLVVKRIVEATLLAVLISGSIYIALDFIFGERSSEKVTKIIRSTAIFLIIPLACLVFVNIDGINVVLWITAVVSMTAACVYAFLDGPLNMSEKTGGFWVVFVIFYTAILYVLLKEILR